jgi:2-C-methyl-D-erythritol 2,4-cyclodiphosphate synthase
VIGLSRVGLGHDVHALVVGRPLVLGGVEIPHAFGLEGYSDADVLVHALMDAILSAMRAGDIGEHFPDSDPRYAGANSIALLERVGALMRDAGWRLVDADIVLALQAPKISPFRDEMRRNLAAALHVPIDSIGLKATTTEGLGFVGRQEGAAAWAVALLERE